jgi:3',5'-cyclic-AMP phosphodiesterase
MIAIAQVSDIHLDGSPERARRARAVMHRLRGGRAPLDAVLVTGDIADHGRPSEYEEARTILSAPCPVLFLPGNHDERDAFRRGLLSGRDAGAPGGGDGTEARLNTEVPPSPQAPSTPEAPLNQVHRVAGAVLALCDSVVPGQDGGYLADETLDWLDALLSDDPGAPALVCLHHYPVPLHTELADTIRLAGEDRLAAVISRHPQVVAVLCGHAHTAAATTFAGRPLLVAPGVLSTGVTPWDVSATADYEAPPAVAYHIIGDDGRLTTHYRPVDLAAYRPVDLAPGG